MRPEVAIHVWLRWTAALAIACFAVTDGGALLPLAALPVWLLSWAAGGKGRDPREGLAPRWMVLGGSLLAVGWAGVASYESPMNLVLYVSRAVAALTLLKLLDRRNARDRAQTLGLCVFLAIGACLTSNSIWLGLLLLAFVPTLMRTSMLHQIASGEEARADSLARLRPADQRRLAGATGEVRRPRLRGALGLSLVFVSAGAIAVFVTAPRRVGLTVLGEWASPPAGAVTGFNNEVRLGTSGFLSESATPVLELRMVDQAGETIVDERFERVYLRGAVLEDYDSANGRWRALQRGQQNYVTYQASPGRQERVSFADRKAPFHRFRLDFRNKAPGELFTVHRPVYIQPSVYTPYVRDRTTQVIESDLSGRVSYTVSAQIDAPLIGADVGRPPRLPALFRDGAVRRETDRVLAEAGLARDPGEQWTREDETIIRALERHLQTRYEYTTEMTSPDAGEDPIEMFLLRTRRGHCEYFASALAAMCRSVGIDARVVTGYVATERDAEGMFLVRESHAHAWVEASVGVNWWKTFDPSPAEGVALAHTPESGLLAGARSLLERLERLWIRGVVSYRTSPAESGRPPAWLQSLARRLGGGSEERAGERDSEWEARGVWRSLAEGAGVFAAVAAAGFGMVVLSSRLARAWRARRQRVRASASDPTFGVRERQSGFYADMLRALARSGAPKPAWRPPGDHLDAVAAERPPLGEKGGRLVELYYTSRFGRRVLSEAEVGEASALLRDFEALIRESARPTGAVGSTDGS